MKTYASTHELGLIIDKAQRKMITTDEAFDEVLKFIKKGMKNGNFGLDGNGLFYFKSYNNPNPYLKSTGGSVIQMPESNTMSSYNPISEIGDKLNDEEEAMQWIAMRLNYGLDSIDERKVFYHLYVNRKTVREIVSILDINNVSYYKILDEVNKKARDILILIPMEG